MSPSGAQYGVVRSYQRIFRPDRRIYQVEGRRIPIPGGIPLVWLGYATATVLVVLLLGARSLLLSVLPILLISSLMLMQPEFYTSKFSDPIFWPTVGVIGVLYLIGWMMIHRIINFRY